MLVVTRTDTSDRVSLRVTGEIDVASLPVLADHLRHAITDCDGLIVIDLGDVTFMGVCGVNALVAAHQKAPARVRLGPLHPAVRRVLELTAQLDIVAVTDGHPTQ